MSNRLLCSAALPCLLVAIPAVAQAQAQTAAPGAALPVEAAVPLPAAPLPAASPVAAPVSEDSAAEDSAAEDSAAEDSAIVPERGQILVIATRIKGQIEAPQAPIIALGEGEIASYGASSLTDLIAALAPQTGSGRGRGGGQPVILLNGQRIANFRELRNFSPEAIKRVEVLPEEVALRYGFPPNQRVINFILKDNYASRAIELDYRQPWAGGSSLWEVEGSLLQIAGPNRFNLSIAASDTTALTEAERPIVQTPGSVSSVAGDPDPAAFRSLIADGRSFDLNTSWAAGLGEKGGGGSLSFSGGINVTDSLSQAGLNLVNLTAPDGTTAALRTLPGALEQANRAISAVAGAGLNISLGRWQFSGTLDYTHAETVTLIDRRASSQALIDAARAGTLAITGPLPPVADAGFDRAANNSERLESLLTVTGEPLRLPAGPVALTLKGGTTWIDFASEDQRSGAGQVVLSRFRVQGGANLSLPLTSRRDQFGAGLGDLTLNVSANLSHVSDFGAVNDWSAGLNWAPTDKLNLQVSYFANQEAPSISQLGNPLVRSFNVPVYDIARGETVLITAISGGNAALAEEEQRDFKLSATWQLPVLSNSNLVAEYFRNRSTNVTSGFPLLTPAIEAAFASRVTRAVSGRLSELDRRPITLAEQASQRIRWGLNLTGTVGKAAAGPGGAMPGLGRPGGGGPGGGGPGGSAPGGRPGGSAGAGPRGPGGGGGPPGMMAMFGGGNQGRWNLGLYHTYRLTETVLISPGGPTLDLLNGDTLSSGGVARHAVELDTGIFRKGIGVRLTGRYSSSSRVRASGVPGSSDLRFASLIGLDVRAFVAFDQQAGLIKALPFLKGSRFALRIDNVLGTRQRVTDGAGAVPLSYQPDYIDPRGRFVAMEWRKQF